MLVHVGLYLTSAKIDRRRKFLTGLAILLFTWPAWYAGVQMSAADATVYQVLGKVLFRAPYYLPFLSFLAYWRTSKSR
jgi:hypothetical protein